MGLTDPPEERREEPAPTATPKTDPTDALREALWRATFDVFRDATKGANAMMDHIARQLADRVAAAVKSPEQVAASTADYRIAKAEVECIERLQQRVMTAMREAIAKART